MPGHIAAEAISVAKNYGLHGKFLRYPVHPFHFYSKC